MNSLGLEILIGTLKIFSFVVPVLVSVALLVYLERKVLGAVQLRKGPNVVGPFGILQSFFKNCGEFFQVHPKKKSVEIKLRRWDSVRL